MEDGSGLVKLIPALSSSELFKDSPGGLICLIRHGLEKNEATGQQMPANTILNEVEIANLVNYLREVYSSGKPAVKIREVNEYLLHCHQE